MPCLSSIKIGDKIVKVNACPLSTDKTEIKTGKNRFGFSASVKYFVLVFVLLLFPLHDKLARQRYQHRFKVKQLFEILEFLNFLL
jgi:hypothetical protein